MFDFARRRDRSTSKRPGKTSAWRIEPLEDRAVPSTTASLALARTAIMATSRTATIPTETILQPTDQTAGPGQAISFIASVEDANTGRPVSGGRVEFFLESPKPRLLGKVNLNKKGLAALTTTKITQFGTNTIVADFIPTNHRAAGSESATATVEVNPLAVKSFLVVPDQPFGHTGEGMTFTVTALDAAGQPVTDYTGTVLVTSPTDSNTVFPARVYVALGIKAPPLLTVGLATFQNQVYTFTAADQGTHTFVDGVTFNKGGAETVKVQQKNDSLIRGIGTFAIS
jgi:protocatechuate 3,4-dioxygenase beta subunit